MGGSFKNQEHLKEGAMQRCIPFFGASARYLLSIGCAGLATRKIQLP
jgi:hypothetical protein